MAGQDPELLLNAVLWEVLMLVRRFSRGAAFAVAAMLWTTTSTYVAAAAPLAGRRAGPIHAKVGRASGPTGRERNAESWVLSNTTYEPLNFLQEPFVGNGYLGLRIPAVGEGYQGGNLGKSGFPLFNLRYTSSLVAGVYASTKKTDIIASLPTWSQVDLAVDGHVLNSDVPVSQISNYRQTVNMHGAIVTTSMTWTPSPGKATQVRIEVLANRAAMHLGEVKVNVTPSWSGALVITGLLNGEGARRIEATARTADTGTDMSTIELKTPGRNTVVVETQLLAAGPSVKIAHRAAITPGLKKATVGEEWTIPVVAGRTYEIIKYVGISTSNDPGVPATVAADAVHSAAHAGWSALLAAHRHAWDELWAHDVTTPRAYKLQISVHSAFYLLYSSIRGGLAWSIPPAGLTSDNYAGMIFWDADTWMYPTLLAFQPAMAKSILDFRYDTRAVAEANAKRAGFSGASWAWDNGPTGTCGGFAPCDHYEDHLDSDIALAQWQYYEATGDRQWLRERGFSVIKDVADFWVSRVTMGSDGKYHIRGVTGPDEFTANVNDESATNAGAVVVLRDAVAAAKVVGETPDPKWARVADNIYVAVDPDGTHPEYPGYKNETVKQADTVLMTYPFGYVTNRAVATADLDRYMPVTDPGGPAMTASVEGIVAAQARQPGCLDYTLLLDSYWPFLRGAYDQFLETQYLFPSAHQGFPTFDFATGAGGFLQMFPYAFAGMRWNQTALVVDPTLPPQLKKGITLRGVRYRGATLAIAIGPRYTTISLDAGRPVTLKTPEGMRTLSLHEPVRLRTARPDLDPTRNLARCQPVTASSAERANQPAAAVDGNAVTNWTATSTTSSYEVTLEKHSAELVKTARAVVHWGATRPANYSVSVLSADGHWQQVDSGAVPSQGELDAKWTATPSRAVRFSFRGGSAASITELEVPEVGAK